MTSPAFFKWAVWGAGFRDRPGREILTAHRQDGVPEADKDSQQSQWCGEGGCGSAIPERRGIMQIGENGGGGKWARAPKRCNNTTRSRATITVVNCIMRSAFSLDSGIP